MKRFLAILLVVTVMLSLCACDSLDYKKAMEAYESGDYETALAMFTELGDYEDSAQMAKACDYEIASEYLDDKDYAEAWERFKALGDYKDAKEMSARAARCMLIEYLKENGSKAETPDKYHTVLASESDGDLLLGYYYKISGLINIDVAIGAVITAGGKVNFVGSEKNSSHASNWKAQGSLDWDIASFKSGDKLDWDELEASGYSALGPVTASDTTLWLRMLIPSVGGKLASHLADVLEESGLGLTMADIGFEAY